MIILKIILLILVSDFVTGILHWWEDAYGNQDWKFLGKIIVIPNVEHHQYPRKFLKRSFFSRVKISFLFALIIGCIFALLVYLRWEHIFILIYSSLANEFHAISHRSDKENGILIGLFQKIGII